MAQPTDTASVTAAVTPTAMLAELRAARATAMAAEARILELAAAWADAHPSLADDPEPYPASRTPGEPGEEMAREFDEERGIPGWSWSATAPLAAALGRSTIAGDVLIREALILRHRLPSIWSRLVAGDLEAWRARRIARLVTGAPDDVCEHIDAALSEIAHKVGATTLDKLLDEAMLRLHPEEREIAQLEALDRRHATLHEESINDTGVAEMTLRADWKDLHDFDQALSAVAAALGAADEAAGRYVDSRDVRRARAIGVLADPAAALALLEDRPAPRPSKRTHLFVHLSEDAVRGLDPLGRNQTTGRAVLEQQIRDWCARTDTHLTVLPVIDLADHTATDAYEIRDRLRTRVDLINPRCVFPWCTQPPQRCDHDHRVPHQQGGRSCECNVAPLCRRHHRLKTHAGWTYTMIETGRFLWSDPFGQQFLRDHTGTIDVTPPDRDVRRREPADNGCRAGP